jgi:TnpA family transposase
MFPWNPLHGKYPNFKRYFRMFLTLDFHVVKGAQHLIDAIGIARRYNSGEIKHLQADTPIGFVPRRWKKMLYTDTGNIHPRTWEFALAFAMRDALKSGNLFLPSGRHYVSFWNLVYDDQQWEAERQQVCAEKGFTLDPRHILASLTEAFDHTSAAAVRGLPRNRFVKTNKGTVRFGKDEGVDEPREVKKLRQLIEASLPRIRIEHLLMEVDALSGFSRELHPVDGSSIRGADSLAILLASIVAHGTNLGVLAMADSTAKITVDMLREMSKACLRQETLKAANTALVDYQKSIEVSSVWGNGEVSSSDGQRFGVSRSSLITSVYPRYFGYYDQAISVYTHVSDQLSVFNTQVISCGQKEAPYVLNGLLENDPELSPRRHHTDTGGYSDHVFALCFLLGFSFMPRLKSLHKRRLFKIDRNHHYGALEPLFKGTVNLELIHEQWEPLIRVAVSLKNRIVPADVIVKRLVNASPADRLSKALTELGRLVKTVYILQYIQDEQLRRTIGTQLNRGEHRQGVARHVFFADQGEFRTGDLAQIMNKASCLSLLSNAILVWNTVHISNIVSRLRENDHSIPDETLAKVSPLLSKHVIVNGMYDFAYRQSKPMQVR